MAIAALHSTAYLQCQDKDYAKVWADVEANATIPATKCANDTHRASADDLYNEMLLAVVPADFLKWFEASANCENFYRYYQSALRSLSPPCLDGNTSTIELADTTFVTFCLLWHNTSEAITPNTTAPPISTPAPTSSTNYTGIIAGSIAGGAAIAALIVWLILRKIKRKSNGTRSLTVPLSEADDRNEFDFTAIRKYKIRYDDLVIQQVIGTGAYAKVCIGSLQGKPVAIKKLLSDQATSQGIQDFIDEIALTVTFDSPFIIKAIGAAWTSASNLLCVMEYMDMGDLTKYLRDHDSKAYTWREKLKYIRCIVEGLVYLSSISVIHRDLKSRNILLDSTKGAKLADFGIAREDNEATMTREVGTFRWMAPEVLSGGRYSVAADIYSFGMVLSEFDSHEIPYHGLRDPSDGRRLGDLAIIAQVRDGTLRPSFSPSCPQNIVEIATQCLAQDPKDRPSSYQLSVILMKLSL